MSASLEQTARGPMADERQTFVDSNGVPLVRLPWLVDGQVLPWVRPAPRLGEHSLQVLQDLGYDESRRKALLASGAVLCAN